MNYNSNQSNESKGLIKIGNLIYDVFNDIETAIKSNEDKKYVKTGFGNLDSMISGFRRGDLIVIGSHPAMGKTSFAISLAYRMCKNDYNIAYFNYEYSGNLLVKRILSMASGIPNDDIDTGEIDANEMKDIIEMASELNNKQLFLCDAKNLTVNDIVDKCKTHKNNNGLDAVIIDYLQLIPFGRDTMNNSKHELLSHNEELDINVSSLKALAKDLDVPIIALSQLCRNVDKKTEPNISDLLIYGDIEKYFDTVIFVGDRAKNNCESSKTDIIIAKNNNGNTGTVNLRFDKSTGSFNEFDE